ncbi:ParA family protein [Halopelagius longus]|uniref:Cellulose biosynthesis protein BcsQ n=1 Tax=Halopelagius longus TaxID=1236180 RepID=A0A1H0XNY2_9EURY|nr:ParA family protein [Halopelagius longus]RDI71982.1 ParA family protein [Halopelagius longus]SDQ04614.1 Cellulose biosynthesis protein BcsQ [Halopelagius longus]
MLTYSTYTEAGGVGKTTLAANLARAHHDHNRNVLVIDLDPQDGDLTYLLNVDDERKSDNVDTLTHHLAGIGQGPVEHLIQTTEEDIDIIPAHNSLANLGDWFAQAEERFDDFNRHTRLLTILRNAGIQQRYDTLIIDPPATEGPQLYNALAASQNLVIPIELSGKGKQSIEGLSSLVRALEQEINTTIGVLAVVPDGIKHTTDQSHYRKEIESLGFDVPVVIGERASLFEGCWRRQCTAFRFVEEHRHRKRGYEEETLEKIHELAEFLEATEEGGV